MSKRNVLFGHFFVSTGDVAEFLDGKRYERCGFEFTNGTKCGWPEVEHPTTDEELAEVRKHGHIDNDGTAISPDAARMKCKTEQ